jgi:RHS repeat-associated protein
VTDPGGNPLIAERVDSTTWSSGLHLVEAITEAKSGIESGSWVDASIGVGGAALEGLGFVLDPVGSLVSMGVAWLIEHVKPLSDALDWLAGDPDQIAAYAQTWANVATRAGESGQALVDAVGREVAEWSGTAAEAYRGHVGEQATALGGIAEAAAGIGEAVQGSGELVAAVRMIVRDLVAECVAILAARLPMWTAKIAGTLGGATPWVVAEVAGLVAKWAARISRFLDGLIRSLANLFPLLGKLVDALARLRRIMRGLTSTGDPFVRVADDAAGGLSDAGRVADDAADGLSDAARAGDDVADVAPGGGIRDNVADPSDAATPAGGRTTTGDPIDVATGEVVMTQTDVQLPGVLPLVLARTHVSSYRVGRWFGSSWASTLDQRLEVDQHGVCYAAPDGMLLLYPTPAAGGEPVLPAAGPRLPLATTTHGYAITDPAHGHTMRFLRPGAELRAGVRMWPLGSVEDRNGNRIELEYDAAGSLRGVRHSGGYYLGIETARGRITALRLRDAEGGERDGGEGAGIVQVLARFGYDDLGRLIEVYNSSDVPMEFDYDPDGRLIGWRDRIGGWYRYDYNADGRCARTTGDDGMLECRLTYDLDTRTTVATDSLGHSRRYMLNELGHIVQQIDPLGRVTTQECDRYGRLLVRTDPLGRTTTYVYDADGNLVEIVRPDGARTTVAYNPLRLPARVTDPDGSVRRFDYDRHGNLIASTDPTGATIRYTYGHGGRLASATDPLGNTYQVETNRAGLPVAVADPTSAVTRYERDALGRVVKVLHPTGGVERLGWTDEGQLTWRALPDGATERWQYDAEGNLVAHTDAVGNTVRFQIGQFGLTTVRTNADGTRLTFDYDTELRLAIVTNPQGLQWRYKHDAAGQLVAETDFNGHTISYSHDAAGQLASRTNGLGETVRYVRDAAGNIVEKRSARTVSTFGYDAAGRLVGARNDDSELTFIRDSHGRVIVETCNGLSMTSRYDLAGRRVGRRTPFGAEATWAYDARGLPTMLDSGGHTLHFAHDAAGREINRQLDASVALAQTWDANHRLLTQTLTAGLPADASRPSAGVQTAADPSRLLERRTWHYRPDGHLSRVDSSLGSRRFDLDPAGRVTTVHGHNWAERYVYDSAGNVTDATWPASSRVDPLDADIQGEREYVGTLVRRAGKIRYEHDACGRVILRQQKQLSGRPRTWRYSWDAENRLTSVRAPDGSCWRYHYDALGRRIAKKHIDADGTVIEQLVFVWDGPILAEQTRRRGGTAAESARHQTTTWDWRPDTFRPLTQIERTTLRDVPQSEIDRRFYAIVTDHVDAPTELVAPDGNVAWRHQSTLWGAGASSRSDVHCPLRFPGQYSDPETGAHYNYHRYYDPTTARYHTPDSLGLAPAPHPHAYVVNPNRWIDPLGLAPCDTDIPWSSPGVSSAARDLEAGATSVTIRSRSEAEELFLRLYQGHGYQNATGFTPSQTKDFFGQKPGTYHWDDALGPEGRVAGHAPDNPHGALPHLQVHTFEGPIIRIFWNG